MKISLVFELLIISALVAFVASKVVITKGKKFNYNI